MAPRYIFSPSFSSSNDGVNHLIAFEANLHFSIVICISSCGSRLTHESPGTHNSTFIPETPAGPSTSSRRSCAVLVKSLRFRLPFVDLQFFLFTRTKRKWIDRDSIPRPFRKNGQKSSILPQDHDVLAVNNLLTSKDTLHYIRSRLYKKRMQNS